MTLGAYYNDCEPFVAAWLRKLIDARLLPAGDVDERPIQQVAPDDLKGYHQVHLFAGIGGWAYALELAGWPADRPVWTGSCPCPPFSSAGKKKPCPECGGGNPLPCPRRTGFFICCLCGHAWLADERHLWPEVWRLLSVCRPAEFFGEQVASADGRVWLASVRSSLEILGYSVGAADLCAAGSGAPHIRQRLWFVADAQRGAAERQRRDMAAAARGPGGETGQQRLRDDAGDGGATRMADTERARRDRGPGEGLREVGPALRPAGECGAAVGGELADADVRAGDMDDALVEGLEGFAGHGDDRDESGRDGARAAGPAPAAGATSFWADAEWVYCRDGKWRPVKPSISPLATRLPGRVGQLRAAGNAICPQVAAEFIKAYRAVE